MMTAAESTTVSAAEDGTFVIVPSSDKGDLGNPPLVESLDLEGVKSLCPSCKVLAILIYSTLSVVAFVGNALILAVFLRFKRLRTPTNMLIANLAIGDLMISIFCIPLSYWHVLIFQDQRWVFGAFLCKMFNYLQATAVFLSSWTLVAISFDRFMAIQFAIKPWLKMNHRRAFYAIISTWAFSLGMALPLLMANKLVERKDGVFHCFENWEPFFTPSFEPMYLSTLFALQYCLPLAVLLITYTAIGCKMWNSKVPGDECPTHQESSLLPSGMSTKARGSSVSSTFMNNGGTQSQQHQQQRPSQSQQGNSRRKSSAAVQQSGGGAGAGGHVTGHQESRKESVKKLIPMVLLVSALYAVCWLPQNLLMNIWVTYDGSALSYPYILYIWWFAHTLAMSHSVVNPFVYYATNRRIHTALTYMLAWMPWIGAHGRRHNVLAAEFDEAKRRAITSSFRYVTASETQRRTTLQQQKTMSICME